MSRIGGFIGHILEMNLRRPAVPLKVNLALTYLCQYRCQTCDIWRLRPQGELTTAELLEFVRKNRYVRWLDLTGGEIFLRPDIDDILGAIGRDWKSLAVLHYPTNGSLTDRIVESTRRLSLSTGARLIVTVSLDGPEDINDAVRGVPGGYRRQIETFRRLREMKGVKVVLGMTLSSLNRNLLAETLAAVEKDCPGFSPSELHLNVMQLSGHYYNNKHLGQLLPSSQDAVAAIGAYRATRPRTMRPEDLVEGRFLRLTESFVRTGRTPLPCAALRAGCFIDPWGMVYPCISYDRQVGSLRASGMDLLRIWRQARTQSLQREIEAGECPQCWTACEAYQTILGNLLTRSKEAPGEPTVAAGGFGE